MKQNAYVTPTSIAELAMHANFQYPHEVTTTLLGSLDFGSLIDAGSGADTRLAHYIVQERQASYIAIDNGHTKDPANGQIKPVAEILKANLSAANIMAQVFSGDICDIPAEVDPADVVHERFVLMHLSGNQRMQAIRELVRVARKAVVLVEYSWSAVRSAESAELIERFVELSFNLMSRFHTDPFMGEQLRVYVEASAPGHRVDYRDNFLRPEGDWSGELILLCNMMQDKARAIGQHWLANAIYDVRIELETAIRDGVPVQVIPARICTATIFI